MRPLFSFGIVADVQYANKTISKKHPDRRYSEALGKLEACVTEWSNHKLVFSVNLGDTIDGSESIITEREELSAILTCFGATKFENEDEGKIYHVLGNHDLCNIKRKEIMKSYNFTNVGYYTWILQGWQFIVLDGTDVAELKGNWGTEHYKNGQEWHKQHPGHKKYNGGIGDTQKLWLQNTLKEAQSKKHKVIIFCHWPLMFRSTLLNAKEVNEIICKFPGLVFAWMCGHVHKDHYAETEYGMHHWMVPAIVTAPENGNAFGIVDVHEDRLEIRGWGTVVNRTMNQFPI